MKAALKKIVLMSAVALAAVACGNDNDDDNNNAGPNQPNTPAETGNPTSTFKWASVTLEEEQEYYEEERSGITTSDECIPIFKFKVKSNGSFTIKDDCSGVNEKGTLTANELGALDAMMRGISHDEAKAKLKCTTFGDDMYRLYQKLSMTSQANNKYALYEQEYNKECISGNRVEADNIVRYMSELRAHYDGVQF